MKNFIIVCAIIICVGNVKGNLGDLEQTGNDNVVLTALFEKLNWLILEVKTLKEDLNIVKERQIFNENLIKTNVSNTSTEVREIISQQNLKIQQFDTELKQQIENHNDNRQWQCILRRQDGSVNFKRNWTEYKEGFGHSYGEYFIGLEKLHAKTTYGGSYELLFILKTFKGETSYAKFDYFVIGSEKEKYEIKSLGAFTGDASVDGYLFSENLNARFSTEDQDNDDHSTENCAKLVEGGWWFKKCRMYDSHFTAPYLNRTIGFVSNGDVVYKHVYGFDPTWTFVEMFLIAK